MIEIHQAEFEFTLFDIGFSKVQGEIIFWFTICNIGKGEESYALFQIQRAFGEWVLDIGFVNVI